MPTKQFITPSTTKPNNKHTINKQATPQAVKKPVYTQAI